MYTFLQDLRFGLRGLRRHPALAAVAVLSLGLGIGANTTVFTWLNSFVLNPLPAVPAAGRLVAVNTRAPDGQAWSLSYPDFKDQRELSRAVELAAYDMIQLGLREGGGTERVWGMMVSGNYFDVLRMRPFIGRMFQPDEEDAAAQVAVLGHAFWQRRFAGDSSVIGRSLILNGQGFTVVGVAPPRFGGTYVGLSFDLYVPATTVAVLRPWGRQALRNRGFQNLGGVGRMRDGVTLAQARDELDRVAREAGRAGGAANHNGVIVRRFTETEGAPAIMGPVLKALLGVTALVLLIACANVANLLLGRAAARRREIGIRIAVGASRRRLVRQLLTEGVALAGLAGAVGVLLALWGRDLMEAFIPAAPFPIGMDLAVDARVLVFALLVTLASALAFGLAPALQASNPDLVATLKDEIGAGAPRRSRLQGALVVGQVGLSLVSLVCAGLFLRSLQHARAVDVGFSDPERLLLISTDLQLAGVEGAPAQVALTGRLIERLRAVSGVEAASLSSRVPLGFGGYSSSGAHIEGYEPQPNENMSIRYFTVAGDYFRTMRVPLVLGRGITDADVEADAPVVVVNQAFVRRYLAGREPIGARLTHDRERWLSIVGVARDGKYQQLTEDTPPLIYRTYSASFAPSSYTVHVRAAGRPDALAADLRRAFSEVSADLPFLDVRTMARHMEAAFFVQRIGAWMLAVFGVLALLLSAIGIYGVMAYNVSRRVREIGVRVALGAERRDVVALVVGRAMRLAGFGLACGALAALGAGQLMRTQLLGISPRDPLTFATIGLLLALVAFVASWIPARRAARTDPMAALRYE